MKHVLAKSAAVLLVLALVGAGLTIWLANWEPVDMTLLEPCLIVTVCLFIGSLGCCIFRFFFGDLKKNDPPSGESTGNTGEDVVLDELNRALNLGLPIRQRPVIEVVEAPL